MTRPVLSLASGWPGFSMWATGSTLLTAPALSGSLRARSCSQTARSQQRQPELGSS